jgi:hypothetical protein
MMKVLKESERVERGGLHPSSVVLLRDDNWQGGRHYSTRIRVYPPSSTGSTPYDVWGHYDLTVREAYDDFNERVRTL